eukprot:4825396-Pleurochrysis_carterae.AAC.1
MHMYEKVQSKLSPSDLLCPFTPPRQHVAVRSEVCKYEQVSFKVTAKNGQLHAERARLSIYVDHA